MCPVNVRWLPIGSIRPVAGKVDVGVHPALPMILLTGGIYVFQYRKYIIHLISDVDTIIKSFRELVDYLRDRVKEAFKALISQIPDTEIDAERKRVQFCSTLHARTPQDLKLLVEILNGKLTIFERRWVRLNKQNNNFVKRIFKENELKRSLWDFYDQYDVNKEAVFESTTRITQKVYLSIDIKGIDVKDKSRDMVANESLADDLPCDTVLILSEEEEQEEEKKRERQRQEEILREKETALWDQYDASDPDSWERLNDGIAQLRWKPKTAEEWQEEFDAYCDARAP